MDSKYKQLVVERNKMRDVMKNGRSGTPYHMMATIKYHNAVKEIKSIFRKQYNGN